MELFHFTTADDIIITGLKSNPTEINHCILCLPMMPATKESFEPLLKIFDTRGWLGYAIDFRGHGDSTQDGMLDYHDFSDEEHQKYRIDAYESLMLLCEECDVEAVIGASIGANIALELQSDFEVKKSVLLSPGLDYRGIETLPPAKLVHDELGCYIIASEEKNGQMAQEAESIFAALGTSDKKIDIYPTLEHGTDIVMNNPESLKKIVEFLEA